MTRNILLVTERRADYSRFKPILEILSKDTRFKFELCVTGLHLLEEHGKTIDEIVSDGFKVDHTFEMFLEETDTISSMVRSLANAITNLSYIIDDTKPDIILSGFDIAANLAITIAGAHMNIPVAHIQGGEVTGTIDESIRHAMSKFAHYHFAANQDACMRLIKMGEREDCVFNVGCPSIDALLDVKDDKTCLDKFNLIQPFYLVLQHPVTTEYDKSRFQMSETLKALERIEEDVLIVLSNNDAGYSVMMEEVKKTNFKTVETLSLNDYVNLLKRSEGLIGNSSSGIHETNTFNIPTVNIGTRQNGRLRSDNIIDVPHDAEEIVRGIQKARSIKGKSFEKLYGIGNSSKNIVEHLASISLDPSVVQKEITY